MVPAIAQRSAALIALAALVLSFGLRTAEATESDLAGAMQTHVVRGEETLLDVARTYDLGFVELMAANPGADPWLPGDGAGVIIPNRLILPDGERRGLVVNLVEMRIFHFGKDGALLGTWPIGIGRESFSTPRGSTKVVRKKKDPTWYPTKGSRADNPDLPAAVPPGEDNPLGDRALYLGWPTYLIHGTNNPWGIGRRVSRGCLRLYPEDIKAVFDSVPIGTPVRVIDTAYKLGWHDGELYIEVHPNREQSDQIEAGKKMTAQRIPSLAGEVRAKAGDAAARIDWKLVTKAETERLGYPIQITTSVSDKIAAQPPALY